MSAEVQPLNVPITLSPAPYTLASTGFLSTLAAVEADVAALAVTDAESAQRAANIQGRLTKAGSELEKARKTLKQPFIDAGRAIDAAAEAPAARIELAKQRLKRALTDYDDRQRKLAREAEEARQKELRRLEEIARAEEAERKRKAEEDAAATAKLVSQSPVPVMELDDDTPPPPTATEQAIATLAAAPAVVAARPTGIAFKTTLVPTVTDISKLADIFVEKTPRMQAIKAAYCTAWKEGQAIPVVPGLAFEVKREPVSLGR